MRSTKKLTLTKVNSFIFIKGQIMRGDFDMVKFFSQNMGEKVPR